MEIKQTTKQIIYNYFANKCSFILKTGRYHLGFVSNRYWQADLIPFFKFQQNT